MNAQEVFGIQLLFKGTERSAKEMRFLFLMNSQIIVFGADVVDILRAQESNLPRIPNYQPGPVGKAALSSEMQNINRR